jgi:hypothetical protein
MNELKRENRIAFSATTIRRARFSTSGRVDTLCISPQHNIIIIYAPSPSLSFIGGSQFNHHITARALHLIARSLARPLLAHAETIVSHCVHAPRVAQRHGGCGTRLPDGRSSASQLDFSMLMSVISDSLSLSLSDVLQPAQAAATPTAAAAAAALVRLL